MTEGRTGASFRGRADLALAPKKKMRDLRMAISANASLGLVRPISELRLLGHYVFASSVLGEEVPEDPGRC